MTSDDWFAGFGDDEGDVGVNSPVSPAPARSAPRYAESGIGAQTLTHRRLGYLAGALVAASFFADWYRVEVADTQFALRATSPWILGFFAFTWVVATLGSSMLVGRRLSPLGALALLMLGLLNLFIVAVLVFFQSVIGWVARLANGLADSGKVDVSIGLGTYLQVAAGLIAVGAGGMSFARSAKRGAKGVANSRRTRTNV